MMQVGCGVEEEEHICIAYENNRWFNLRHDALTREVRRTS